MKFKSFFILLPGFLILTACEGASFAPKDAQTDTNQNNINNLNNDAGTDHDNVETCSFPDIVCGDDCCTNGARCRNGSCCDLENLCGSSFCCEEGESCMGGYCHLDCEFARCLNENQQEMCCGSEELCFMNECIIPGAVCENDSQCLLDEYCEVSVGKCLPIPESTCEYFPPIGEFSPIVEWSWPPPSGSPVLPDHVDVLAPPVIGDMNGDGIPEIAFVAYKDSCAGGNYNTGVLTILRGSDGTELLRLDDPARRLGSSTMPALGDIDLDGLPEVVVMQADRKLLAYELDGTLIWESEVSPRPMAWGAISIGDLNYDSIPEIVFGTTIYDPFGNIICAGTGGGTGGHNSSVRSISVLSDVTGDGYLEIVAGNTVYDRNCNLIFESPAADGYAAVADIYDSNGDPTPDGVPEIAIVGSGYVTIINGQDGTILWGPEVIPGGQNRGGAPVIADFDGDGYPEIGTAGGAYMIVYDPHDATPILWQKATKDTSSALTGCTVFDFEADGSAEIIYTDECFVYIYRGTDGEILFKEPNNTRTHNEYPIVVDVDGDGSSELVVTSNVCVWNCEAEPGWSGPAKRGITVYGDVNLNWVRTKKIWNQHSYHVTNINDNGTIPTPETKNWTVPGLNNFRQNIQTWGVHNAPDAEPQMFGGDVRNCGNGYITLGLMVANNGSRGIPPGMNVSFFRILEDNTEQHIGFAQTTSELLPGMSEYVEYEWNIPVEEVPDTIEFQFAVLVDDPDLGETAIHECNEENNYYGPIDVFCDIVD